MTIGGSLNIGNGMRICMGKSCWMTSLAIQQLFPIQILLIFPRFELLQNLIFECYRPQTWQNFLLIFACIVFVTIAMIGYD